MQQVLGIWGTISQWARLGWANNVLVGAVGDGILVLGTAAGTVKTVNNVLNLGVVSVHH